MSNPYNKINLNWFILRRLTSQDGQDVFIIQQDENTPFDMCVFRDYLVRFLFENLNHKWELKNIGNNYELTVTTGFDVVVLGSTFKIF